MSQMAAKHLRVQPGVQVLHVRDFVLEGGISWAFTLLSLQ